jgi:hypothetical protein
MPPDRRRLKFKREYTSEIHIRISTYFRGGIAGDAARFGPATHPHAAPTPLAPVAPPPRRRPRPAVLPAVSPSYLPLRQVNQLTSHDPPDPNPTQQHVREFFYSRRRRLFSD